MGEREILLSGKEEEKKDYQALVKKYEQELVRLNTMFLKGRLEEDFYDTEYLRLTELIKQNKAMASSQGHTGKLEDIFYDSWKEMYFSLEKLDKKLFWRSIIKEIIVDKNMNIIDVIFL